MVKKKAKQPQNPVVINHQDISNLEIIGERNQNGTLNVFSRTYDDWPNCLFLRDYKYFLEDTESLDEVREKAYYHPA